MLDEESMVTVLSIGSDGRTNKKLRYLNTRMLQWIVFENTILMYISLYTNAPGYSAYNHVELRIIHLSKRLSGLVLPHDPWCTHLDDNGKTVDENIERINFEKAGEALVDLWSKTVNDSDSVHTEFVKHEEVRNAW